jgi:hypothetical protein
MTARRIAIIASVVATGTAVAAALLGGQGFWFRAFLYFAIAAAATVVPALIVVQVISGALLAAGLLLMPDGPSSLVLLPVVAGVVATAELLGVAARTRTSFGRDPGDDLRRAWISALIGGGVFGVVALVARFPGPGGPVAVVLASAACAAIAVLLVSGGESE